MIRDVQIIRLNDLELLSNFGFSPAICSDGFPDIENCKYIKCMKNLILINQCSDNY